MDRQLHALLVAAPATVKSSPEQGGRAYSDSTHNPDLRVASREHRAFSASGPAFNGAGTSPGGLRSDQCSTLAGESGRKCSYLRRRSPETIQGQPTRTHPAPPFSVTALVEAGLDSGGAIYTFYYLGRLRAAGRLERRAIAADLVRELGASALAAAVPRPEPLLLGRAGPGAGRRRRRLRARGELAALEQARHNDAGRRCADVPARHHVQRRRRGAPRAVRVHEPRAPARRAWARSQARSVGSSRACGRRPALRSPLAATRRFGGGVPVRGRRLRRGLRAR